MTRNIISYLRRALLMSLVFVLLLVPVSCGGSPQYGQVISSAVAMVPECNPDAVPPPRSSFTIQDGPIAELATEVSKGVGKVIAAGQGTAKPTIIIFEEKHDSRLGQMEIALMLWRLQKNQGLRVISLEGAMASQGILPAKWFHEATGADSSKRAGHETAVRLLREGEINAAEFVALAQPEVQVRGNELETEYAVEPSETNSALVYLAAIAEGSLSRSDALRVDALVKAGKHNEAIDAIFSRDSWCRERYQKLFGDIVASTEESAVVIREIETKAKEVGVKIDPRQETGLHKDLNFYETASRRSCTMVKNTLAMMDAASSAPLALLIGAAHTPKIVALIKAAQLSYAVVAPRSLVTATAAGKLTGPMYNRKMAAKSTDGAGMLGALLDGRKKLPPVLGQQWFRSKSEIYFSLDLIVRAAARNERVPSDELRTRLASLQSIKIDWPSLKVSKKGEQSGVMYKVTAQTGEGGQKQAVDIWVGGWSEPPTPPPPGHPPVAQGAADDDPDPEKLILAALAEEGVKKPAGDNGKPGRVAVVQLSAKTKAAFSTNPALLQSVIAAR